MNGTVWLIWELYETGDKADVIAVCGSYETAVLQVPRPSDEYLIEERQVKP